MLHNRIRSLLLLRESLESGAEGENGSDDEMSRIENAAEALLAEWQGILSQNEKENRQTRQIKAELERQIGDLESQDVKGKHRAALKETYAEKFKFVGKTIDRLEELSDSLGHGDGRGHRGRDDDQATKIQSTILTMLKSLPHRAIPTTSALFKHLQTKTGKLKETLLLHFHAKFDALLENGTEVDHHSSAQEGESDGWSSFLSSSRTWLLAYVMVSILPKIFSESDSTVLECYQGALDEALTPLWGRYRFHLTHAAESGNKKQIIWSFSYAKEFIRILHGLCIHLSMSTELRALFAFRKAPSPPSGPTLSGGNDLMERYPGAGLDYMVEKAGGLFRAHLAKVLLVLIHPAAAVSLFSGAGTSTDGAGGESAEGEEEDAEAASGKFLQAVEPPQAPLRLFCLHLVEECLVFDAFLRSLTLSLPNPCPGEADIPEAGVEGVVAVLRDSPEITAVWLASDVDFMHSKLTDTFGVPPSTSTSTSTSRFVDAFKGAFDGPRAFKACPLPSPAAGMGGASEGGGGGRGDFCFSAVFEALSLFSLAGRRYALLVPELQALFSTWILEPLLVLAVALLVVRVRRDPLLCHLADGSVSEQVRELVRAGRRRGAYADSSTGPSGPSEEVSALPQPRALVELVASVEFLNAFLADVKASSNAEEGTGAGSRKGRECVGDVATETGNFASLWDRTYEWLPRNIAYMNEVGLRHVENSLLPKLALQCMPRAAATAEGQGGQLTGFVAALRVREKTTGAGRRDWASLHSSIDQTRAQAITLANVLERQFLRTAEIAMRLER